MVDYVTSHSKAGRPQRTAKTRAVRLKADGPYHKGRKANRLSDDHRKGTRSWAKSLGSYSAEATQNQTIVGAVGASDWQLLERVAITLQIIR